MAGYISLLKFVGTVSLGLLTGASASIPVLTLPTLRSLPSSPSASRALTALHDRTRTPFLTLTSLSTIPLLLSFVLSPPRARHPYLFYTALLAGLSAAADLRPTRGKTPRGLDASYEVLRADDVVDVEDDVNGEEVGRAFNAAFSAGVVRAALAGAGFVMSVVGIWGDGAPVIVFRA